MPALAAGASEQAVGRFIADDLPCVGVDLQAATRAQGDVGQMDQGHGAT